MFVRDVFGEYWYIRQGYPAWEGWRRLGGFGTSSPAAVTHTILTSTGRVPAEVEVYVRGDDGNLHSAQQVGVDSDVWRWTTVAGGIKGDPGAAMRRNGDGVRVFVQGEDDTLYSIVKNRLGYGVWEGADPVPFVGRLSVGVDERGRPIAFVSTGSEIRGVSRSEALGMEWVRRLAVTPHVGSPAVATTTTTPRFLDTTVYVRHFTRSVREQPFTEGRTGAQTDLGGDLSSDPAAFVAADGRRHVFALGGDFRLWARQECRSGDGRIRYANWRLVEGGRPAECAS
ncbi:hypothetical protein [Micromonospora sp. KC213]|uniref:hypothetical protein n=1 Tax=Micromonospora sp. KC213 TaxID=2530378 RepID=UPI00105230A4|nr:hypothetical protein [Micromonospora sp. KC213]TDC43010.1 hypothetical protein E1166_05545 [Micromonospora sp. KC213]